jgi:DNA adenine methylase
MAVLFAKPPSQKETVCDLHGDLVNLASCVQNEFDGPWLFDRLQRTLFSEGLLRDAQQYFAEMPEPCDNLGGNRERAYWYFLASWMGRNGTAGTARVDYQIAVRWTKGGGSPTVRWRHAVESLPAWHRRLQNVVILCRDAFSILDRFEDVKETAIYADPPYADETRGGGKSLKNGRGGKYLHEFKHRDEPANLFTSEPEEEEDKNSHVRLRDALARYKHARVVVSYYDCPRIRELYAGWNILECTRQKLLHAQNGRGARPKEAPEILIVNGPIYGNT